MLRTTSSTGALPPTHDTARRSRAGCRAARSRAHASSTPVSTSSTMGVGSVVTAATYRSVPPRPRWGRPASGIGSNDAPEPQPTPPVHRPVGGPRGCRDVRRDRLLVAPPTRRAHRDGARTTVPSLLGIERADDGPRRRAPPRRRRPLPPPRPAPSTPSSCAPGIVAGMDDDERAGQLLMVGLDNGASRTSLDALVARRHLGGVILLGGWDGGTDRVRATTRHLAGARLEGGHRRPRPARRRRPGGRRRAAAAR